MPAATKTFTPQPSNSTSHKLPAADPMPRRRSFFKAKHRTTPTRPRCVRQTLSLTPLLASQSRPATRRFRALLSRRRPHRLRCISRNRRARCRLRLSSKTMDRGVATSRNPMRYRRHAVSCRRSSRPPRIVLPPSKRSVHRSGAAASRDPRTNRSRSSATTGELCHRRRFLCRPKWSSYRWRARRCANPHHPSRCRSWMSSSISVMLATIKRCRSRGTATINSAGNGLDCGPANDGSVACPRQPGNRRACELLPLSPCALRPAGTCVSAGLPLHRDSTDHI